MADKQSREGMITYKCINCYAEMSVSNRKESRMDGRSCFLCEGPIIQAENNFSAGDLTVNIDCSAALKGLKALQREARETTKALRELEEQQNKVPGIISIEKENKIMKRCRQCGGKEFEHQTLQNLEGTIINTTTICAKCGETI